MPGQRIVLSLKGFPVPAVTGNVRVMIHPIQHTVVVHIPVSVPVKTLPERPEPLVVGLDAGVTEVFADSRGHFYGEGFGRVLDRLSAQTAAQGKERNRLYAAAKKLATSSNTSDRQKAGRIQRFNLGRVKLDARRVRGQAEVKRWISEATREALRSRPDAGPDQKSEPLPHSLALDAVKPEGKSGIPVPSGRFPVGDGEPGLYLSGVSEVR